jgi:acyl-CoA synthetase (AMP-forming)/AMP-acid ligase II
VVLFSSGSTGSIKAAVHDLEGILKKFRSPRRAWRTIPFLLYDHIGGLNTMLYALFNGGCLVTVQERTPDTVLQAVSRHQVELLPTSPTFINLLLLSEAYLRHDLSSLKMVTYGTETMPESTLKRFHQMFPGIQLLQTYGLSEVGILRSKSRASDSLWLKVGGEGFSTRVVDGMLEIKAESAMLGYLNAPSPFTEDGWLQTGDMVDVDGEFIRILGRRSDLINVGGEKVFPSEVESVIGEVENVAQATVYPEKNAILGNIVCARVRLQNPEARQSFILRLKQHCRQRLERFKIPVRVTIVSDEQHTRRFKKRRNSS